MLLRYTEKIEIQAINYSTLTGKMESNEKPI